MMKKDWQGLSNQVCFMGSFKAAYVYLEKELIV